MLVGSKQFLSKYTGAIRNPTSLLCCKRFKANKKGASGYLVEPTTMKIQKLEPALHNVKGIPPIITSYNTNGFVIQGNRLYGSVAILPQGFYSWKALSPKDISVESLQLFNILNPNLEILVIGTGDRIEFISPEIRRHFRKYGIGLEVLDTRHACSIFNFMLEEERRVGAALIPPAYLSVL